VADSLTGVGLTSIILTMVKVVRFTNEDDKKAWEVIVKKRLSGLYLGNYTYALDEEKVEEIEKAGIPFEEVDASLAPDLTSRGQRS